MRPTSFLFIGLAPCLGVSTSGCGGDLERPGALDLGAESAAASVSTLACDVVVAGGSTAALAAALTSAREGASTCLLEPTDWVGGQLTAGGVPAIDYAWHTVDGFRVADVAALAANQPPEFFGWMQGFGAPRVSCWVSRDCYEPKELLTTALNPAVSRASRLTVLRNTVVKRVTTADSSGKRTITSVVAIRRTPRAGVSWGGYDRRLSEDLPDWYSPEDSARYTKEVITLTAPSGAASRGPIVIDATELGDVLALSGAPYLQGVETADGSLDASSDTCGQAFAFSFVMRYGASAVPDDVPVAAPDHPEFYGLGRFDWDQVWTYRRIQGTNAPAEGQLSLQNWNPGNDYGYGYLLLPRAAAEAQRSDWRGGVSLAALEAGERHAYGWFRWYAAREPRGRAARLSLARDVVGTGHGLFKFPYVRDTRRSIGVGGFVLRGADLTGPIEGRTGRKFADRVALGAYAADLHPMQTCSYPAYATRELPTLPFFVPLRALTNRDVGNLLVAGKTMAQSFLANAATRLQPIEWSTGIAAGAAASYMVTQGEKDTARVVRAYAAVQSIVRRHAPVDWTIDGVRYPRPTDTVDGIDDAPSDLRLFCPPGSTPDLSLGYCVDAENAYGPFTKKMTDACVRGGGGSACAATLDFDIDGHTVAVPRWGRAFAERLRGNGRCLDGAREDERFPRYCVEDAASSASSKKEVYGPFEARLVDRCLRAGGGDACYTNRWSYAFFVSLAGP